MPRFQIEGKGSTSFLDLPEAGGVIGRSSEVELQIDDASVSRRHCSLERRGGGWWVIDLGSANGTRVNGELLKEPRELRHGDRLRVGSVDLRFEASDLGAEEIQLEEESHSGAPPGWRLRIEEGEGQGEEFPLKPGRNLIGRSSSNDVPLRGLGISSVHAEVIVEGDGCRVRDLGSTNGSLLDGAPLKEAADFPPGSRLMLGKTALVLEGAPTPVGAPTGAPASAEGAPTLLKLEGTEAPRGSSWSLYAFLVILVALGGGSWYFFFYQGGARPGRGPLMHPSGSLIAEGWSLEEADALGRWRLRDEEVGSLRRVAQGARTGANAMELGVGEKGAPAEAVYATPIPVDAGRVYRVGAFVRAEPGAATLQVMWHSASGEPYGTRHLPRNTASGGAPLEGVVAAPEGAASAEVACLALAGRALFDDVTMTPVSDPSTVHTFPMGDLTVVAGPRGVLAVRKGGIAPIRTLQFAAWDGARVVPQDIGFEASPTAKAEGEGWSWQGPFQLPGAAPKGDLGVTLQPADRGFKLECRWKGTEAPVGLAIEGRPGALKRGVLVVTTTGVMSFEGPFRAEQVVSILVGEASEETRILLSAPMAVQGDEEPERSYIFLRLAPATEASFTADFRTKLTEERSQALSLVGEAQLAERGNENGKAALAYERLLREFPVDRKAIAEAEAGLRRLEDLFQKRYQDWRKRYEDAKFFRDRESLTATSAEATAARARFQGSRFEAPITKIAEEAAQEEDRLRKEEEEAEAQSYLVRARDFATRKEPRLTEAFLRYVAVHYSRCPAAAEAKQELQRLGSSAGSGGGR